MGAVDSSTLTLGEGFDLAASQRLLEVCLDSTQEEAQMLERVQAALIQGADPNVALPYLSQGPMNGPEPRNPTMAACALGYPGVLACLLEAGAWAKGPAYDPPYDDSTTNEEGWHPLWLAMYQLGWAVVEKTPPQRLHGLTQCVHLLMQAGADPHTRDPGAGKTPMSAVLVTLRTKAILAPTVDKDDPHGMGKVLWAALNTGTPSEIEERLALVYEGRWLMLPLWSSMEDIPELKGWLESHARQHKLEPVLGRPAPGANKPRF